jgi:hypothetical protein
MQNFVGRIASDAIEYRGDLRPAVMAAIAQRPRWRFLILPHWALVAASFVFVASGVAYWMIAHPTKAIAPAVPVAKMAAAPSPEMAEADSLIESRQFAQAYALLAKYVGATPRADDAAVACQKMSEIAFGELQWYPQAFDGYDRLRRDYADQFRADEINFVRLNLLDEARGAAGDYASLKSLDAARRDGSFEAYEKILAKYPATYVGSQTANELAMAVAKADGFDPASANGVRALKAAQFRAKDPVAKAQLRLEVAHALRRTPGQADEARRLYSEMAKGPFTAIAEMAKKSLAAMDAPASPGAPRL